MTSFPTTPSSSPLRGTSGRVERNHHTPVSAQVDLQSLLSEEIRDHAWEFNSNRITEMLSVTGNGPTETLVNSAHKTLKPNPPSWHTAEGERDWYSPIAMLLNNCVDVCNGALDGSTFTATRDSRPRLHGRLKFITCDEPTEGGVEGAAPVKPDLVGGLELTSGERVAWSPHDHRTKQVLLLVEVKADWTPVVNQAMTYARYLFSASPSRHFTLVLGFRHTKAELRFLVFHRGGLKA